jgi:DNA-directed RNA polymerase subunit M/transcription elongation factor TFIIS
MEMLMLKKLNNYFDSFDPRVQEGVRQALEYFKCCDEALELLNALKAEELENDRIAAEETDKHNEKVMRQGATIEGTKVEKIPKLTAVVGICPRCSSKLVGFTIPGCEKNHSSRIFYKECTACTYYAEVFKKRNKHYEVEGG